MHLQNSTSINETYSASSPELVLHAFDCFSTNRKNVKTETAPPIPRQTPFRPLSSPKVIRWMRIITQIQMAVTRQSWSWTFMDSTLKAIHPSFLDPQPYLGRRSIPVVLPGLPHHSVKARLPRLDRHGQADLLHHFKVIHHISPV